MTTKQQQDQERPVKKYELDVVAVNVENINETIKNGFSLLTSKIENVSSELKNVATRSDLDKLHEIIKGEIELKANEIHILMGEKYDARINGLEKGVETVKGTVKFHDWAIKYGFGAVATILTGVILIWVK